MDAYLFDKIEVKTKESWTSVPIEQWMEIAPGARVAQIMEGQVRFSLKGAPVRTTEALKSIRAAQGK